MSHEDTKKDLSIIREASHSSVKRLLTLRQAADYLGRTEWSMRDLLYSGGVSFVQFPGERKYYFDVSDLNDLIESNKGNFKKGA